MFDSGPGGSGTTDLFMKVNNGQDLQCVLYHNNNEAYILYLSDSCFYLSTVCLLCPNGWTENTVCVQGLQRKKVR